MSSKIKILQVIPKLGYGGAETGCFDLAHYLHEHNCKSYIVTSGGPLLKYINKKKKRSSYIKKLFTTAVVQYSIILQLCCSKQTTIDIRILCTRSERNNCHSYYLNF